MAINDDHHFKAVCLCNFVPNPPCYFNACTEFHSSHLVFLGLPFSITCKIQCSFTSSKA